MNLVPSKLGADPKKIAILGGLVLLAAYFYFSNSNSGGGPGSAPPVVNRAPVVTSPGTAPRAATRSSYRGPQAAGSTREFKPSLKPKNVDTTSIDPTLRLDLLAKLKTVDAQAGTRSLFEIGVAPPAEIKGIPEPAKIAIARPFVGPVRPVAPEPAPEPKAPPIQLKFYGFVNKTKVGDKRAFFLDGEDIVIAGEGDMIKKRYKIIRIGVNSAVVEDTQFKSNNQQTLPLEAEMVG
jgi:hypothetical protein